MNARVDFLCRLLGTQNRYELLTRSLLVAMCWFDVPPSYNGTVNLSDNIVGEL